MMNEGEHDQTVLDALKRHLQQRPQANAYIEGDRVLSFEDVERITNQMAHALVAAGVQPGERVGMLTRHHVDCILAMLACCKVGAVLMPVNWRLAVAELQYILDHGQVRLLLTDAAFAAPFTGMDGAVCVPRLSQVVCIDHAVAGLSQLASWYAPFGTRFTPVEAGRDDPALQLYSSGTTGLPKGVVLSHRGLLSTSRVCAQAWHFGAEGIFGNPLPTFHVAGMTMLLLTLYTGGSTLSYPEFDPADFIRSIGRDRVTHTFLVPAMLMFMLQSPELKHGNYATLKQIAYGGSPISQRVLSEAIAAFGCGFLQIYGLTEVSGPATFLSQDDHLRAREQPALLRSAGRPVGGGGLRIVDPVTGQDLPEGEVGEVWFRSERNLLEYWRDPQATAEAFPQGRDEFGGWFRTGDGGRVEDSYLYITDRIKDMIISGGENIYPAEIENLLMSHPDVADAAIIGVPDEVWGESVKACVVLRPGTSAEARAIIDWMRERLAHYKCPKTVDFVDALPRNPTGKILKRTLRAPYWAGRDRAVH